MTAEYDNVEKFSNLFRGSDALIKRLLDNAFSGLSLIALGGLLSGFLSYCVSYGQFSELDPHLMPAFSSTDLATNFAILAIPLFNAVVATILMAPVISDFVLQKRPIDSNSSGAKKLNFALLFGGIIFSIYWIMSANEINLVWFRLGVLLIAFFVAFIVRARNNGTALHSIIDWKNNTFSSLHLACTGLVVIAFTLSNYGKHETIMRMRELSKSNLYMLVDTAPAKKVVVIFASQERAVVFDGRYVSILPAEDYEKLVTKPDLSKFDERTFLNRLFNR